MQKSYCIAGIILRRVLSAILPFLFRIFWVAHSSISNAMNGCTTRLAVAAAPINSISPIKIYVCKRKHPWILSLHICFFLLFRYKVFRVKSIEIVNVGQLKERHTLIYGACANWFDHFNHGHSRPTENRPVHRTMATIVVIHIFHFPYNNISEFTLRAISGHRNSSDTEIKQINLGKLCDSVCIWRFFQINFAVLWFYDFDFALIFFRAHRTTSCTTAAAIFLPMKFYLYP